MFSDDIDPKDQNYKDIIESGLDSHDLLLYLQNQICLGKKKRKEGFLSCVGHCLFLVFNIRGGLGDDLLVFW